MEHNIISLLETSENNWQAKYRGNYGTYTIKIKMGTNQKMADFSCSCPSDYYPCKHIPVIMDAIEDRIKEHKVSAKEKGISPVALIKNISHKELIDFMVQQVRYNPQLSNAILLKFSHQSGIDGENKYRSILSKALKKVHFNHDDIYEYHEDSIEIDVLDEWLEKAKEHLAEKNYKEAVAIAKACIEEYAAWMEDMDSDIIDYIDVAYQDMPFEILQDAAVSSAIESKELFQYCKTEMVKPKYGNTDFGDGFNSLMKELAGTENAAEFIQMQDDLLNKISDKSSYEAEKILRRKTDFYTKNNQPETAWKIISENIQIESFRIEVVKKRMAGKNWTDAKKLINDYLHLHQNRFGYHDNWHELILEIAQKEKDIPVIRKTAWGFIENRFQSKYYRIYKSTYSPEGWDTELEKIIARYAGKHNYFNTNIADVLAEEKAAERLMKYIEKYLSAEQMDKYHIYFSESFPEATLSMFQRAVNQYAESNTGRSYYEYIVNLMKKMQRVRNGKEVVNEMLGEYKIRYKNRKAMMEILGRM